ncbi:MAG: tetratricopeptide repeat protein [Nitrosospira sp.]
MRKCPIREMGSKSWRWPGYMKKRGKRKKASNYCFRESSPRIHRMPKRTGYYWLKSLRNWVRIPMQAKPTKMRWRFGQMTWKYSTTCNVWRCDIATIKKSEQLARYGWDRLRRIEDLQRLMRFSWKRKNLEELDQWLSLAESLPSIAQAPDYWYFRSMRKMASGERDAAREALRELLRLRGPDPEITEAMIWLLLSEKKIDQVLLEAVVKPYRNPSGNQSVVSPPLTEALAAAEQTLGNPVQAAARYLRSLDTRSRDFLWTLTLADNMEWSDCFANANQVRFSALQMFASQRFAQTEVEYPSRLAEYFRGLKDPLAQSGNADNLENWQSMRERWGFTKALDNVRYFALRRERERLQTPAWEAFADAVKNKDYPVVSAQLSAISAHLEHQPGSPSSPKILPLSMDDVDLANRWLAGEAAPHQSSLNTELEVCRKTLAKVRELQMTSRPDKEPAAP